MVLDSELVVAIVAAVKSFTLKPQCLAVLAYYAHRSKVETSYIWKTMQKMMSAQTPPEQRQQSAPAAI